MRVIAGSRRSMPLKAPTGLDTRPTQDRTKETLFNVLQNNVPGCVFADLFSGSGGIGIEALSRGAQKAYFIENGRQAVACVRDNINFTRFNNEAVIMECDVLIGIEKLKCEKEIDIIFMDPPYDSGLEVNVLTKLAGMSYVTEYTIIVVESLLNADFSYLEDLGFEIYKVKQYKTNQHVFIRKQ
jgi:16S rRNA (guanine966-N2)-methyltransferase